MEFMDVIVVGSCNFDLINYVDRFPLPGETIRGAKFVTALGGKGSNQAAQCAKLGARVAMIGKVGTDYYGDLTLNNFDNVGVDRTFVTRTSEHPTGTATVVVRRDGKNFIIVNLGANLHLFPSDIDAAEEIIKHAKILVSQLEIDSCAVKESFRIAKKYGVTTLLNPAPCPETFEFELLKHVDILCLNETEAQILTKVHDISDPSNLDKAFEIIFDLSSTLQLVIFTQGEQGCHYAEKSEKRTIRHVPADKMKPIDTTGAGDSFVGSLAFYLSKFPKLCTFEQIRRSCVIASRSVLKQGAQISYLGRNQMEHELFSYD